MHPCNNHSANLLRGQISLAVNYLLLGSSSASHSAFPKRNLVPIYESGTLSNCGRAYNVTMPPRATGRVPKQLVQGSTILLPTLFCTVYLRNDEDQMPPVTGTAGCNHTLCALVNTDQRSKFLISSSFPTRGGVLKLNFKSQLASMPMYANHLRKHLVAAAQANCCQRRATHPGSFQRHIVRQMAFKE